MLGGVLGRDKHRIPLTDFYVRNTRRTRGSPRAALKQPLPISKGSGKVQVVFVSTEVSPWSKTGGLGDVMDALPVELATRGHRVMTVSPRYAQYNKVYDTGLLAPVEVPLLGQPPEPECGLSVDGIWEAPQPPQEEEDGHRDDDYSTDCRDLADAAAGHAPQPSESRSAHHHSHQSHTTGHLSEQVLVQQQELTEISYARYYAVEDRGVLRVFVDHPVFAAPLTDEGSRYEHGQEQRSGMLLDPAPRAGPIFTYGEGADNLELQARNSVLCQAALAAPVLLWGSPEALPRDLQQSAGFSTTPLALQNGLARACAADPNAPRTDSKAAAMQDYAASPLLFVSNDWPTALLPLWLKAYRDLLFTTQAANAFLAQAVNSALVPPSSLFSPVESDVDSPTITEPTNSSSSSSSSSVALDAGSAIEAAACGTVNGATAPGPWSASIAAVGAQPGPLEEPLAEQNGGSSGEGLRSVLIAAKLKARALARSAAAVSEAAAAVAALGVPPFAQYWERQRTSPPIKRPATASTLASAPASVQSASPQHFCSARQQHGAADEHSCDTPLYPDPWQQHLHPQQVVELQQCTLPQQPQPHPPLLWSQSQPLSLSTGSSSSNKTCSGTGIGAAVYVDGEAVRMPPSVPDGSGLFGAGSSGLGQYDSAQAADLGAGTAWHQQQQQLVDAAEQRAGMQFMTDMHGMALGVEIDAQLHEAAFPHVPGVLQADSAGRGRVTSSSRDEASSMQGASACVDGASLHGALPSTGLVMSEAGVAGAVRAAQTDAQALQALVLYEQRRQEQLLLQLFYAVQQLYPGIMGDGFDEAGLDANASEAAQYLPGQRVSKRSDERQRSAEPRVIRERMQRTLANFRRLVASRLEAAKVVFTMHNAAFQGLFSAASFARLGLPQALLPPMLLGGGGSRSSSNNDGDDDASSAAAAQGHSEGSASSSSENASGSWDGDEHGDLPEGLSSSELSWEASGQQQQQAAGRISWLKAALLTSDALVTVSPTYARELAGRGRQVSSNEMQAQVSPGHSAVMGLPCEGIQELQGILRTRGLQAITNGLDTVAWDPATDPLLPPNLRYQAQSVASGKARAKAVLQVVLGLEQRADVPLIGFVGRLEEQKGADVLLAALPALLGKAAEGVVNPSLYASAGRLLAQAAGAEASTAVDARGSAAGQSQPVPDGSTGDAAAGGAASATGQAATPPLPRPAKTLLAHANASHLQAAADASLAAAAAAGQLPALQLAMLGLGQAWLQDAVTALQGAYPGRAAGIASFSEELAHLMMAGCDYLIVPSRYEPCGLVAMAALRYGTVPIVAPTGGLLDIVRGNASSSGACTDAGSAAAPDNSRDSVSGRRPHGEQVYGVVAPLGIILRTAIAPAGDAMRMRLSQQAVADAIGTACELFGSRHFEELRLRCMQQDVSWSAAAEQWEALLHAVAAQADQPDHRA